MNFLYRYFEDRLEDERCLVDKSDLEDIIDRCEKVLENGKLAEELLPTRSGFFFGSTEYDIYYYRDVHNVKCEFEKLLKDFNEDTDVIIIEMIW